MRRVFIALSILIFASPVYANVVLPSVFLMGGYQAFVIALICVILIEWRFIARWYPNNKKALCFLWSILVNLATTVIGMFYVYFLSVVIILVYLADSFQPKNIALLAGVYIGAYILSAVIEWLVLIKLQQKGTGLPAFQVLVLSLKMNLASYLLLFVAYLSIYLIYMRVLLQ